MIPFVNRSTRNKDTFIHTPAIACLVVQKKNISCPFPLDVALEASGAGSLEEIKHLLGRVLSRSHWPVGHDCVVAPHFHPIFFRDFVEVMGLFVKIKQFTDIADQRA